VEPDPAQIGAFEAKTKLGELLEKVRHGATFTISKHDRPIARLIGYEADQTRRRAEAVALIRSLRTRYRLEGVDARILREEGRA